MTTSSYREAMVAIRLANASPYSGGESSRGCLREERVRAQKRELPCLSASISSVRCPAAALMPARLVASVVFPVPPFSASSAMITVPSFVCYVKTRCASIKYHNVIRRSACFVVVFPWMSGLCPSGGTGPQASSMIESDSQRPLSSWDGRTGGRREMGRVAETEDAPDLKSGDPVGHVGSTPTAATTVPTEMGGI